MRMVMIFITSMGVWTLIGCGDQTPVRDNIEQWMIENAMEQTVSTYHEVSLQLEVNGLTMGFQCQRGGSGTLVKEEDSTQGKLCWTSTLEACRFKGDNGGEIALQGKSQLCYLKSSEVDLKDGWLGLVDAGLLNLSGDMDVSGQGPLGREVKEEHCEYQVEGNLESDDKAGNNCVKMQLDGSIDCGHGGIGLTNMSIHFCISGEVEVSSNQ